jgi:hypothetical protein
VLNTILKANMQSKICAKYSDAGANLSGAENTYDSFFKHSGKPVAGEDSNVTVMQIFRL